MHSKTLVTLDFETYYSKDLSLTKMTTMDYVRHPEFKVWGVGMKINDGPTEWHSGEDLAHMEWTDETSEEFIDWDEATLLCHNTHFDGYVLAKHYGIIPKFYADTAAMSRALNPGLSASLKDCCIRTFPNEETMRKSSEDLWVAKGIRDLDWEREETLANYCIQDVDLTYALYQEMLHKMPQKEMELIDITCRMFTQPKLTVDREALTIYRDEQTAINEELITKSGIPKKVLSSNQQFAAYLETDLNIVPPTKRNPKGKQIPALGKNDKAFTQLQKMYPDLQHVWDARKAVKSRIAETRAQRFLDATNEDGTISAPLRYYASHTGRWGGTEKINMMNMPRNSPLRLALQAPKGSFIYVADLSQIEARLLAWLAGEDELISQFANGEDIYSNLATRIYGRPINKKDHPVERFVGKTAILGLGYGMGADKFKATLTAANIEISTAEAYNVVNTYRNLYSNIPMLWKKLEIKLASTITSTYEEQWRCLNFKNNDIGLPNGLALRYNNLRFENGQLIYDSRIRETTWAGRITENVVQALARIVIGDAIIAINKDKTLGDVVLTVHDEIILIGTNQNPDATMAKLIQTMCIPPAWAVDLPLDAEGGYDVSYSK